MWQEWIEVRAARENNLRDVSLNIPKRRITVCDLLSAPGSFTGEHLRQAVRPGSPGAEASVVVSSRFMRDR